MVSTCNRTELYLVVGDPVEAETAVVAQLARRAGLRPTQLLEGVYSERNCDAARHLYRVVGGLESMVVGEAEVQGQVKRAYELALHARAPPGTLTNKLFRAALADGQARAHGDRDRRRAGSSVASVAVELATDTLGDLSRPQRADRRRRRDRRADRAGAARAAASTTLFVANRRRERAETLAPRFGGAHAVLRRAAGRAAARRHRRRLHLLAARADRGRGARRGRGASATAGRCC